MDKRQAAAQAVDDVKHGQDTAGTGTALNIQHDAINSSGFMLILVPYSVEKLNLMGEVKSRFT